MFSALALLSLVLGTACDDTKFGTAGSGSEFSGGDDFCAIRDLLASKCTACHGATSAPSGDLDLATDPYAALVDVPSTVTGWTLVIPGEPEQSLLYVKVAGTQPAEAGGEMPPGSALPTDAIDAIYTWIADGASSECSDPGDGGSTGRYHPDDQALPEVHGLDAKLQEETCIECHGDDLTGGSVGVSCDLCHEPQGEWRTDCTFCHGDPEDGTGAPPRDIDGTTDTASLTFSAHRAHVGDSDLHDGFDCVQCHRTPTDVLSSGHVFVGDSTPAVAELDFSGGLSDRANYNGGASCSNLYCHGYKGGDNGSWSVAKGSPDCGDCHADKYGGQAAWRSRLSEAHEAHLENNVDCASCHGATVSNGQVISNPSRHVNGDVDIQLTETGITWNGRTCTGVCHAPNGETEEHEAEPWE